MIEYFGDIAITDLGNGTKSAFHFKNSGLKSEPNITTIKVEAKDKQGEIVSWGKNNNYPQLVMESVRKNGSASSSLRFLRHAHYGNGLTLFKDEVDDNGKKAPKAIPFEEVPEIDAFFKKSYGKRFFKETILDLEYFGIGFPEYVLSNNFETINRIKRQKAAWCRYEVMNEKSGLIENVYVSQKFGTGNVDLGSIYVETIPHVDPYWTPEEVKEFCKENKITRFIRPVFYPMVDEGYYPTPEWHSVIESGWMDVANDVPALKKSLFKNQMTIKYIVEIMEEYFIARFDWSKMSFEEKQKERQNVIDAINKSLVGNDNAGKSIQSMKIRGQDGQYHSAVTITSVDDKLKDGSYLPEAEAANSEILVATGVDASLIGGSGIPGGKIGAGSGSDKRVAFDILNILMKSKRETPLEIFEFISQYNNWDSTIKPVFESSKVETLDKNPTGVTNVKM